MHSRPQSYSGSHEQLYETCFRGNINKVHDEIQNGATAFNSGLYSACRGGHKDIALLMIEKGATNFNVGFYIACSLGHEDIVLLLIEKGAKDFNGGCSCIINFMLMNEKNKNDFDNNSFCKLLDKCKKLMLLMAKKGATDFDDLKYSKNGHKDAAWQWKMVFR